MSRLASLILAASTAACSPARPPAGTVVIASAVDRPAPPPSAILAPAPVAVPGLDTCRIAGPKANLTVAVTSGEEEISVTLRGAPVVVVPRSGSIVPVEVGGALAFEAHAEGLVFHPVAPVVVAGGLVGLGPTSFLQRTSPRGAEAAAWTVDVGEPFVLARSPSPAGLSRSSDRGPIRNAHHGNPRYRLGRPACPDPIREPRRLRP